MNGKQDLTRVPLEETELASPSCPGLLTPTGTHCWIRGNDNGSSASQPVVICVHGIGSYHSCFNGVAEYLTSNGFIVVQYDLIGRGYSQPSPNQKYGKEEHLNQLHSLLTEIASELPSPPYHFLCHSMGGALGTLFAQQYPQYIRTLTLLAPAGLMGFMPVGLLVSLPRCVQTCLKGSINSKSSQVKAWRDGYQQTSKPEVREMADKCVADHSAIYAMNSEMTNAFWQSALSFPVRNIDDAVKSLGERKDLKVLLLWGDKDRAVPLSPSYNRWVKLLTSQCTFETKIYKDVGHCFYEEVATEVLPDIRGFLEKY